MGTKNKEVPTREIDYKCSKNLKQQKRKKKQTLDGRLYLSNITLFAGQCDFDSIQLWCHLDLTTKSRRFCKADCKIEHVQLLILRLLQLRVPFRVDNQMAGRTCKRSSACAFEIDVIINSDVEEVLANARMTDLLTALSITEDHAHC
eukprot:m.149648 g.149648  ORF g.149648 m.149648 type:complete len:147 (-) comp16159_c0_seq1:70-510(-)